jgi:uncharacterized repeat protein (TIGR02543 family)
MAVTYHKSSTTIRGVTYNYGDKFTCYAANGGATDSEGSGSAIDLTKGTTYYYLGYSWNDDNDTLTSYPYAVGATSSSVTGWYKANVFPYATYKITYNANGGSGAPSAQTKTYGTATTLSSTKPTRTGYTFKCWNTKSDGSGTNYNAGASYSSNSAVTLYAIWTEHYLTMSYYSNGATWAFDGALNAVGSGKNVKVFEYKFYYGNDYSIYGLANYSNSTGAVYMTRTGYTATGDWGTTTSGGTLINENTTFTNGQSVAKALGKDISSGNASVNVYAQWSENKLTINYYSNYANYGTYQGETLNVSANSNTLLFSREILYDNSYTDGLADVQNQNYLYLSRAGYTPTGYWGTSANGGTLVDQKTSFSTGQAFAQAFGKTLENGNASVNVYPQWQINTYTINYDSNGGTGSMNSQTVEWGEDFVVSANTFEKEGYKCIGYNVKRSSDNKWYVTGQKWQSESDIELNVYTKKLYVEGEDNHTMGSSWTDGTTETDTFTFYAVWKLSGVIYIDNGVTLEPYLPYIDNGTSWDLYLAYVDNGTEWNIIS